MPDLIDPNAAEETSSGGDALFRRLRKKYRKDRDHWADWRDEAKKDYDFVAGEQWDPKDVKILKDASRPVITFNRIDPLIRSVAGDQINNTQEIRYIPREQGDAKANEGLTSAARWFRDQCDADDEESDAFWDAATCGMGVTDSRLDLDEDPNEPMPVIERIDPLEMIPDRDARKRNLSDARRWWRVREMPLAGAKAMFPDAAESDLDAGWAKSADDDEGSIGDRDEDNRYGGAPDEEGD